jgi:Mn2+/Fe2+ NRAMP family transporter
VTGVGHARLIFERFGKFWGAFSVIDLFLLNALTIVTEFIGISLALDYLGVSKLTGVGIAAALTILGASTGNFRRFERFALMLCFGSLLLVPILLMAHPPLGQMARDLVIPGLPEGKLSDIMLLITLVSLALRSRRGSCSFSRATWSTSAFRRASWPTSVPICGLASSSSWSVASR